MQNFLKWYATSSIASYIRVFLSVVLFQAITDFARVGHILFTNWETWVIAGLVSLLAPLSRNYNPQDKAFGAKG